MSYTAHRKIRGKKSVKKASLSKEELLNILVKDADLLEQRQEFILRKLNILLEAVQFFIKRTYRSDGKVSSVLKELEGRLEEELKAEVYTLNSKLRDTRPKTEEAMLLRLHDSGVYLLAWRQEQMLSKMNILLESAWFALRRSKRHLVAELSQVVVNNPRAFYSRVERPQFIESIIEAIKLQFQDEDKVQPL